MCLHDVIYCNITLKIVLLFKILLSQVKSMIDVNCQAYVGFMLITELAMPPNSAK